MLQGIDKAVISFRIFLPLWMSEKRFNELLTLFEKYRGVTDEITFFTGETHSPLALKVLRPRLAILSQRMAQVRKLGYRAGINVIPTTGFMKENAKQSLAGDYTQRILIDGNIWTGSYCPNDPKVKEYVQDLYRMVTEAGPDYIWLDDDVYAGGCFCDYCLDIFAKTVNHRYSREELRSLFNEGSIESKLDIRKKWTEHGGGTINVLLELIENTIHGISPKMPIGVMTCDRFNEGYDLGSGAKILSGVDEVEVMWRPGDGFWSDENPLGILEKSHKIGRQVSMLPDSVRNIQAEIESFMYQRLKKSKRITAIEPAVYIAAGATGTAFNVLSPYDQPLDEYEPLVAELCATRPFYDLLVENFSRSKPQGIYTGWNRNSFAAANLSQGDWYAGDVRKIAGCQISEIFEIGLPAAYSFENAQVTMLVGDAVRSFTPNALEKILSGSVYIDTDALNIINQIGYGELTGFKADKLYEADCIEQLVSHPLNSHFVGYERDCRQAFAFCGWNIPVAALVPQNEKSQILSRIVDFTRDEVASCVSGVFENKLGGRVCVAGYCPWTFMQYAFKSSQMKSIFRWLSKETLAAYVGSFHKIGLWSRNMTTGKQTIALLNASLDSAENVELVIKTNRKEIIVYDMNCTSTKLESIGNDGAYQKFILPEIPSWQMRLVCEK